jgi:cation diffusion facilitator CzcD-associated flavoprotein CzcO
MRPPSSSLLTHSLSPPIMTEPRTIDVAIIGAGFSGLAAACALQQQLFGDDNNQQAPTLVVLEARDRVGGRSYSPTSSLSSTTDLGAGCMQLAYIPCLLKHWY